MPGFEASISDPTFSKAISELSDLEGLRSIDINGMGSYKGEFWRPLAQLRELETLYVYLRGMRAEEVEPASQ